MGCGERWVKDLWFGDDKEWKHLVAVDFLDVHKPHAVVDVSHLPLPFKDNTFDEIHAYDVLEHLAPQGDFMHFFAEFNEYHRILKPGGFLFASCPWWQGTWAWGDPGHTRVIQPETLSFLTEKHYEQLGRTKSSDYRPLIKGYWDAVYLNIERAEGAPPTEGNFQFALRAVPLDDTHAVNLPAEPADENPGAELQP